MRARLYTMLKRFVGPVILAAVLAAGCRNTNIITSTYANLEEARSAGAVARGYLPEGLPPNTQDIREAHDPDGVRHWAIFSFSPSEADRLRSIVGAEDVSLDGQECDIPGRVEWWPVVLRERLDGERIKATGLLTYRSRGGDFLYAVNWKQGRAYFWTAK